MPCLEVRQLSRRNELVKSAGVCRNPQIELALILWLAVWIVFFAPNGWLQYLLLLGCAAALLLLFRSVLPFLITEIGVTNQRLIVKRGWLAGRRMRSRFDPSSRSISSKGLSEYGQVDVDGTGVDNLIIPPIADPIRFVKAIEDAKGSSKAANSRLAD
jgi:hypothetical protein